MTDVPCDWLNERTDTDVDFFGVEVSVVQTGPRAPVFEVVARPNGWRKGVKEAGGAGAGGGAAGQGGGVNVVRQDFFVEVLTDVVAQRPGIRLPTRGTLNWLAYAAGPWGNWAFVVANDGRLRVEAYLDSGNGDVNKGLFDELQADAVAWETKGPGHVRRDERTAPLPRP